MGNFVLEDIIFSLRKIYEFVIENVEFSVRGLCARAIMHLINGARGFFPSKLYDTYVHINV